jgi:hypothetical protein
MSKNEKELARLKALSEKINSTQPEKTFLDESDPEAIVKSWTESQADNTEE